MKQKELTETFMIYDDFKIFKQNSKTPDSL